MGFRQLIRKTGDGLMALLTLIEDVWVVLLVGAIVVGGAIAIVREVLS